MMLAALWIFQIWGFIKFLKTPFGTKCLYSAGFILTMYSNTVYDQFSLKTMTQERDFS